MFFYPKIVKAVNCGPKFSGAETSVNVVWTSRPLRAG